MAAPLTLNSDQLRNLADALDGFTAITVNTGVRLSAGGSLLHLDVDDGGALVAIDWDSVNSRYCIDDHLR